MKVRVRMRSYERIYGTPVCLTYKKTTKMAFKHLDVWFVKTVKVPAMLSVKTRESVKDR